MIVYLIRHGETAWNKQRRLQGQSDIPLNEFGVRLAEETREGLKGVRFDLGITSPLRRARETAEIILDGSPAKIIEDARIQEISFGSYEGMIYTKEKSEIPDENFGYFFTNPERYQPTGGGETLEELLARERAFWQELIATDAYRDSTILVSTHGAALSGLLSVIKGNPIEKFWDCGLHKNCGISIVEVKTGKAQVLQEAIVFYEEKTVAWD